MGKTLTKIYENNRATIDSIMEGKSIEKKLAYDAIAWQESLKQVKEKADAYWKTPVKNLIACMNHWGVELRNANIKEDPKGDLLNGKKNIVNNASIISHGGRLLVGPVTEIQMKKFINHLTDANIQKDTSLEDHLSKGLHKNKKWYKRRSTHKVALKGGKLVEKKLKPWQALFPGRRYQFGLDLKVKPPGSFDLDKTAFQKGGLGHMLLGIEYIGTNKNRKRLYGAFIGIETSKPQENLKEVVASIVPFSDKIPPHTPTGEYHRLTGKAGKHSVTGTDFKFPKTKDETTNMLPKKLGGVQMYLPTGTDWTVPKYELAMLKKCPKKPDNVVEPPQLGSTTGIVSGLEETTKIEIDNTQKVIMKQHQVELSGKQPKKTERIDIGTYLSTLVTGGIISKYEQQGDKYHIEIKEEIDEKSQSHAITYAPQSDGTATCTMPTDCGDKTFAFLQKLIDKEGYYELDISDYPPQWQKKCKDYFAKDDKYKDITFITNPLRRKVRTYQKPVVQQKQLG